jgi:hypothetical protein
MPRQPRLARVVKFAEISVYLAEALLKDFDETWGARIAICRRDRMNIMWNWN